MRRQPFVGPFDAHTTAWTAWDLGLSIPACPLAAEHRIHPGCSAAVLGANVGPEASNKHMFGSRLPSKLLAHEQLPDVVLEQMSEAETNSLVTSSHGYVLCH